MYKTRITAVFALALALLAGPALAEAGWIPKPQMTIRVVDEDGKPQPGSVVISKWNESGLVESFFSTGINGETPSFEPVPGRQFLIRRYMDRYPSPNGCQSYAQANPEGKGVIYRIPNNPPETATVVLPSIAHRDYVSSTPGADKAERGLIGAVNRERQGRGLEPLDIESRLSEAADRYANYMSKNNRDDLLPAHCGFYDFGVRATSAGFWGSSMEVSAGPFETRGQVGDALLALNGWMNSPKHREILMTDDYNSNVIGVGSATVRGVSYYIVTVGLCYASGGCDHTGDYGDASLLDEEEVRPNPPQARPLRIYSARGKRHGRAVKITLRMSRKVNVRHVSVRSGQRRARASTRAFSRRLVLRARLRPGSWKVRVKIEANGKSKIALLRIRMPKHKRGHHLPVRVIR